MNNKSTLIVAGLVLGVSMGAAVAAKREIVTTVAADLKWVEIPQTGGVQVANVQGDMLKGAYSAFVRFPAGHMHPLHTHSKDVKSVVVSGTFLLTPEGGSEAQLGPGSYFVVPGGLKHTSGCAPGAACVLFQEGPGKFDMKPVVEKTATEKPAAK